MVSVMLGCRSSLQADPRGVRVSVSSLFTEDVQYIKSDTCACSVLMSAKKIASEDGGNTKSQELGQTR